MICRRISTVEPHPNQMKERMLTIGHTQRPSRLMQVLELARPFRGTNHERKRTRGENKRPKPCTYVLASWSEMNCWDVGNANRKQGRTARPGHEKSGGLMTKKKCPRAWVLSMKAPPEEDNALASLQIPHILARRQSTVLIEGFRRGLSTSARER